MLEAAADSIKVRPPGSVNAVSGRSPLAADDLPAVVEDLGGLERTAARVRVASAGSSTTHELTPFAVIERARPLIRQEHPKQGKNERWMDANGLWKRTGRRGAAR